MISMKKKIIKTILEYTYLFVIGCIAGYLFEVFFYFLKNGEFFNKKGLIIGTFKPIYGFGIILINILLNPLKDKGFFTKYIIGCILGTIFEYISSLVLEYLVGIYSWDYSKFKYSFGGGRLYLPYCFFWGFLVVFWLDYGYPFITKQLNRINRQVYNILGWCLLVFMSFNFTLTAIVSNRISERAENLPATNIIDRFIDKYYPQDVARRKLPQLKVISEK